MLTSNLFNYAMCRGKFADKRLHSLHKFQRLMMRAFVLLASSSGKSCELKQLVWGDLDIQTDTAAKPYCLAFEGKHRKLGVEEK